MLHLELCSSGNDAGKIHGLCKTLRLSRRELKEVHELRSLVYAVGVTIVPNLMGIALL